jgi:aminoglycoside phosphotransferase (APT) family kinase protein
MPQFPSLQELTVGLRSVLAADKSYTFDDLTIIDRLPNVKMKTFLTEVVICRLDKTAELRLFCKYESGRSHNSYGHRGGIAYEAEVYRRVLRSSEITTPIFYGAYSDVATGDTWLILEYLNKRGRPDYGRTYAHIEDDFVRLRYKLGLAARWIGQFHASNENRLSSNLRSFLKTYDAEYYHGWARRTSRFAENLQKRYTWLATVCRRYQRLHLLSESSATIIHGEYYKHNIIHLHGAIYPVDWESAAIAPGEIDLASLTERWPAEIAQHCEAEYREARWPEGAPSGFDKSLDAARLYVQFRWLGDQVGWTIDEDRQWRFEELRVVSERLGLI